MKSRTVFKLLVFLLAGAIINVAVAWACGMWINPWHVTYARVSKQEFIDEDENWSWIVWVYSRPGAVGIQSAAPLDPAVYEEISPPLLSGQAALRPEQILPSWSPVTSYPFAHRVLDARGWPCISLWCETYMKTPYGPQPNGTIILGIELPMEAWQKHKSISIPRPLPMCPTWPGFAINMIFYAAIVWVLFAVPGAVRRRLRHKRGQCASCAYSLRENVSEKCPECGAGAS